MRPVLAVELAKSGEAVKAGPIGLAVILLLCIACYFLFKSMSKHMRNVRENFPKDAADGDPGAAESATAKTDQPPPASPAPPAPPSANSPPDA